MYRESESVHLRSGRANLERVKARGRCCDPGKTVEPVMKDTENSEELAYDRFHLELSGLAP